MARAQLLAGSADGPFIVCSEGLLKQSGAAAGFPGGLVDYAYNASTIREEALYANSGKEFLVHGSHVEQSDPHGDCEWSASASFKGNADDGLCPATTRTQIDEGRSHAYAYCGSGRLSARGRR